MNRAGSIHEAIEHLVSREPGRLTRSDIAWFVVGRRKDVFAALAEMLEAGTLELKPDPRRPSRRVLIPVPEARFRQGRDTVPGGRP